MRSIELKIANAAALALALGTAACGKSTENSTTPAPGLPIHERASALQEEYGTLLGRHFYAVGGEVKCRMDAVAASADQEGFCREQILGVIATEANLQEFQRRHPQESAYFDQHCTTDPMLVGGVPVLAFDCRFEPVAE